uniref:Uncharacterized protein n=1 Tax=Arundo donax TaxID=35708 RepID=A0A0A9HLT6_ARUDO
MHMHKWSPPLGGARPSGAVLEIGSVAGSLMEDQALLALAVVGRPGRLPTPANSAAHCMSPHSDPPQSSHTEGGERERETGSRTAQGAVNPLTCQGHQCYPSPVHP